MTNARKHAFTLVELLVVIGIIALLISVLMPALSAARRSGRDVQCASNVRQITNAAIMYASEWKGVLPRANTEYPNTVPLGGPRIEDWLKSTMRYLRPRADSLIAWRTEAVLACPSYPGPRITMNEVNYGMNQYLDLGSANGSNVRITQLRRSAEIALFGDKTEIDWSPIINSSGVYAPARRHGSDALKRNASTAFGQANIGFADGHVAGVRHKEFSQVRMFDYTKK